MDGTYRDIAPSSTSIHSAQPSESHAQPEDHRVRKRPKVATSHRGDRGVASLTAEQLAKKRAVDREAQRAIRERTKNQIETLEEKVRELTSQQPYQDLQAVIRQRDAVQADKDELKRKLAGVLQSLQSVLGDAGAGNTNPLLQKGVFI